MQACPAMAIPATDLSGSTARCVGTNPCPLHAKGVFHAASLTCVSARLTSRSFSACVSNGFEANPSGTRRPARRKRSDQAYIAHLGTAGNHLADKMATTIAANSDVSRERPSADTLTFGFHVSVQFCIVCRRSVVSGTLAAELPSHLPVRFVGKGQRPNWRASVRTRGKSSPIHFEHAADESTTGS